MYVRLYAEQISALASALLAGYRSPFTGAEGAANPVVWGGLVITNSATGLGAKSAVASPVRGARVPRRLMLSPVTKRRPDGQQI
jgi:hypothetical protein